MFEIGNTLREARRRRGLEIGDCEAGTKIRPKYLRALEEEQFDLLPSPAYVRGFLRSYAEFLDLDGQLVIDEYESRFAVTEGFDEPRGGSAGAATHVPAGGRRRTRVSARRAGIGSRPGPEQRRRTEAHLLWLAIGGVLTAGILVQMGIGNPKDEPLPVTADPAVTTGGSATPDDPRLATPEQPERFQVRLTGTGTYGSYIEVRRRNASGSLAVQTILQSGQSRSFRIQNSVWVKTANPEGLKVEINGKQVTLAATMTSFLVTRNGLKVDTSTTGG